MSYSINSRYYMTPLRSLTGPDGEERLFLARRIIPQSHSYEFERHIQTGQDSRIDVVAAENYGDPLLFWRICDANGIAEPADSLKPDGKKIGIPLPRSGQGVDGA